MQLNEFVNNCEDSYRNSFPKAYDNEKSNISKLGEKFIKYNGTSPKEIYVFPDIRDDDPRLINMLEELYDELSPICDSADEWGIYGKTGMPRKDLDRLKVVMSSGMQPTYYQTSKVLNVFYTKEFFHEAMEYYRYRAKFTGFKYGTNLPKDRKSSNGSLTRNSNNFTYELQKDDFMNVLSDEKKTSSFLDSFKPSLLITRAMCKSPKDRVVGDVDGKDIIHERNPEIINPKLINKLKNENVNWALNDDIHCPQHRCVILVSNQSRMEQMLGQPIVESHKDCFTHHQVVREHTFEAIRASKSTIPINTDGVMFDSYQSEPWMKLGFSYLTWAFGDFYDLVRAREHENIYWYNPKTKKVVCFKDLINDRLDESEDHLKVLLRDKEITEDEYEWCVSQVEFTREQKCIEMLNSGLWDVSNRGKEGRATTDYVVCKQYFTDGNYTPEDYYNPTRGFNVHDFINNAEKLGINVDDIKEVVQQKDNVIDIITFKDGAFDYDVNTGKIIVNDLDDVVYHYEFTPYNDISYYNGITMSDDHSGEVTQKWMHMGLRKIYDYNMKLHIKAFPPVEPDPEVLAYIVMFHKGELKIVPNPIRKIVSMFRPEYSCYDELTDEYKPLLISMSARRDMILQHPYGQMIWDIINHKFKKYFGDDILSYCELKLRGKKLKTDKANNITQLKLSSDVNLKEFVADPDKYYYREEIKKAVDDNPDIFNLFFINTTYDEMVNFYKKADKYKRVKVLEWNHIIGFVHEMYRLLQLKDIFGWDINLMYEVDDKLIKINEIAATISKRDNVKVNVIDEALIRSINDIENKEVIINAILRRD